MGTPPADDPPRAIWTPHGLETDAGWRLDVPGGLDVAGGGLAATLPDRARFGEFLLGGG